MAARRRGGRGRPRLHLIAGANGAGKTTFARKYLPAHAGTFHFINADLIAAGLSPLRPEAASIAAGRLLLSEFRRLASSGQTFAMESTLAGVGLAARLRSLRRHGYRLSLYFLWLDSPHLARQRVEERVRSGGHDVPSDTIARRYAAGLENFLRVYFKMFDEVHVYDNSGRRPRLVARFASGRWRVEAQQTWSRILGGPA